VATAMTVLLVGVPSPAPEDTSPSKGTRTASRPRRVPATLLIVFAIVALEFSLSFWLASYLDEAVGIARDMAASMVSGLYAANLCGRVLTGYLAGKGLGAARLLVGSLVLCLAALPVLLLATNAAVALVGIVLVGAAIGAMFPLTSSLHVASAARTSDHAMGEILTVAALGQVLGPLSAGALASLGGLRLGLCVLPVLVLVAGTALARHHVATG